MRASFKSSHPAGDFAEGLLRVRVLREAPGGQRSDVISFSVPADFHVHHDSVAAAMMTLIGRRYDEVAFNFPISRYCAETLTAHYRLREVGPVDATLEPRRRGRFIALNYSGGVDSSAMLALLEATLGADLRVVSTQYWSTTHRESRAFQTDRPHVHSSTNLRRKGLDRDGRFNGAVPLLFADYADLADLVTGHTFGDLPLIWRDLRHGDPPEFLRGDAAFEAGGLGELHLARTCLEPGLLKVLVHLRPERVERALATSGRPGSSKYVAKGLALRVVYAEAGLPMPAFLDDLKFVEPGATDGIGGAIHLRSTFLILRYGRELAARMVPRVATADLSALDGLRGDFFGRYHPGMVERIPAGLRAPLLALFHQSGVLPFDERDYRELEAVRQFILAVNDPRDLTF